MTDVTFKEAVLNHLVKCRAHKATGNVDGEDSVSSVMQALRDDGWKGLGHHSNFEDMVEMAGFTLRRTYKGVNVTRTYISI